MCIHQVAEWCCKIAVFHAHKLGCDDGENGERGGSSHVRRLRGGDLRRLHHAGRRAGECVSFSSFWELPRLWVVAYHVAFLQGVCLVVVGLFSGF